MYNPFEKETEEWRIFDALSANISEDDTYTPLDLIEMTHRCIDNKSLAPDTIKYEQLTLFNPRPY